MTIVPVPLNQLSRVARKIGLSAPGTLIPSFPGSTYGGLKVKAYLVRANGEAQLYLETP